MSEKDKTSDSGIDLRKSDSGSFAGFDGKKSSTSWNDFDDSGQGSSRRGTYDDDDDYDDDEPQKVDLNAFIADDIPAGDDVGDGEEEECDDEEEECSEEDEDEDLVDGEDEEGEFETEEEEDEQLPSDEILTNIETSSAERLKEQKESLKRSAKEKKKDLLNEYMRDVKRFNHLRKKNFLLGMKIESQIDEKATILEKYLQSEREEQERIKEAENLRKKQNEAACKKEKRRQREAQPKKEKQSKEKKRKSKTARFSKKDLQNDPELFPSLSNINPEIQFLLRRKFDFKNEDVPHVSLKKMREEGWIYDTRLLRDGGVKILFSQKNKKCQRPRFCKKSMRRFSFMRSRFYEDVKKLHHKRPTKDLMNLNIDKLRSKSSKTVTHKGSLATGVTPSQVSIPPPLKPSATTQQLPLAAQRASGAQVRKSKSRAKTFPVQTFGYRRQKKFVLTKEALDLARSKSRMALDHRKQENKIQLSSDPADHKNLHHFKFEFADPRLTAKQASVKLRDELIKLLHRRHVPTQQLRWPLEVKGVEFGGKNPYGRVSLNYTRLSHHEKELPHLAYRLLLTNMAFLRTKEQRLNSMHRKNMVELEEERNILESGLREIFGEILEGLRIWASLCGVTEIEKREARNATESFITELQRLFDEFLTEMLIKLYKSIHSCEFVLRQLWISEGKGEGAELHEFKDIMRGREKLKAEHRIVAQSISRYQRHSNRVLTTLKNSGRKLREAQEFVRTMNSELDHLKEAVSTMVEGMYFCQEKVRKQLMMEKELKNQAGILSSPTLSDDYFKLLKKIEDTKSKRLGLQFQYNGKIREIEKIGIPTRYNRYKLRS